MSAFLYSSIILLSPHAKVLQQICDYSGHPYAAQHGYYELRWNSGNTAHVFRFPKAQTSPASAQPKSPSFGAGCPMSLGDTAGKRSDNVGVLDGDSECARGGWWVWMGTCPTVVCPLHWAKPWHPCSPFLSRIPQSSALGSALGPALSMKWRSSFH